MNNNTKHSNLELRKEWKQLRNMSVLNEQQERRYALLNKQFTIQPRKSKVPKVAGTGK